MNHKKQTYFNKIKLIPFLFLFLFLFQFSVADSSTLSTHSEKFTISGKVLDENKKPIQGVIIKSFKKAKEDTTDENGSFILTDVELKDDFIFNSINYEIKVIKIENKDELTIILNLKRQYEIVDSPDLQPSFPGGLNELNKYLDKKVRYPRGILQKNFTGEVFASFIVLSDGNIKNIEIKNWIGGHLDEVTIRAIQSMPKWIPGKKDGKLINCKFTLPHYILTK